MELKLNDPRWYEEAKMMPLMVHTTQPGFPSMTAEILKEIWDWRNEKFEEASEVILPESILPERATELKAKEELSQ